MLLTVLDRYSAYHLGSFIPLGACCWLLHHHTSDAGSIRVRSDSGYAFFLVEADRPLHSRSGEFLPLRECRAKNSLCVRECALCIFEGCWDFCSAEPFFTPPQKNSEALHRASQVRTDDEGKVKVSTILPAELRIYVDRSDVNKLHKMCM